MEIYGIDFTSVPSRRKPITQAVCRLSGEILHVDEIKHLYGFEDFERLLGQRSPWIAALDFPFGQPRRLIENLNWPNSWNAYVRIVASMTRQEFVDLLRNYQDSRSKGDKRHFRDVDKKARSCSPMQLDFTPVAQMFYEGAKRVRQAPVNVVPFRWKDDRTGTVVEGHPALVARWLIGKAKYKTDNKRKWTVEMKECRQSIVGGIQQPGSTMPYELSVRLPPHLAQSCIEDGTGDKLDAVLCAIQAGWAHRRRAKNHGEPPESDLLEGWIADPSLLS